MSQSRPPDKLFTYLSLGAGVQSTAMLVLACRGLHNCPRPDAVVFADTGDEPSWVYEHLAWCKAFAVSYGIPLEVVSNGRLSDTVLGRSFIPYFTSRKGKVGMLRRKCTSAFKLVPIHRWVRGKLGLAKGQRARGVRARALIGISVDEVVRAKPSRHKWVENTHPLLDAKLTRQLCIQLLRDNGVPEPKKSACVFCPYHSNAYWQDLKEQYPEEFARACAADDHARATVKAAIKYPIFLHRSLKPLREIDFIRERDIKGQGHLFALDGFGNECEGMCGV